MTPCFIYLPFQKKEKKKSLYYEVKYWNLLKNMIARKPEISIVSSRAQLAESTMNEELLKKEGWWEFLNWLDYFKDDLPDWLTPEMTMHEARIIWLQKKQDGTLDE